MRISAEPRELAAASLSVADVVVVVDQLRADLRRLAVDAGAWADPLVRYDVLSLVDALDWALGEASAGGDAVAGALRGAARAYAYVDGAGRP